MNYLGGKLAKVWSLLYNILKAMNGQSRRTNRLTREAAVGESRSEGR